MRPDAAIAIEHIRKAESRDFPHAHAREVREHDRGAVAVSVTPLSNGCEHTLEVLIAQYPRPLPEDILGVDHCGDNLVGSRTAPGGQIEMGDSCLGRSGGSRMAQRYCG